MTQNVECTLFVNDSLNFIQSIEERLFVYSEFHNSLQISRELCLYHD